MASKLVTPEQLHANARLVSEAGEVLGANAKAILSATCYVRRAVPGSWLVRVEHDNLYGRFFLVWRENQEATQENRVLVSQVWAKEVTTQPGPLDPKSLDYALELEHKLLSRPRDTGTSKNTRTKHKDELLDSQQEFSFKRTPNPSKQEYENHLSSLF